RTSLTRRSYRETKAAFVVMVFPSQVRRGRRRRCAGDRAGWWACRCHRRARRPDGSGAHGLAASGRRCGPGAGGYTGWRNRLPYRSSGEAVSAPGRGCSAMGWLKSELSRVEVLIGGPFVVPPVGDLVRECVGAPLLVFMCPAAVIR